ncbi:HAD family phosphatase [Streptomyces sp. NPDC006173]|uniref:HAD family hydrolase n=1 Tax=Streptomyces sp. NPDC006173 TaxID=3155349 RepID=UPI00340C90AF
MDTPYRTGATTLLLEADGALFPSEEPAFVASAAVTRDFARHFGLAGDFSPEYLRRTFTGQNFRSVAQSLLDHHGMTLDAEHLQSWVNRERAAVTTHLGQVLQPQPDIVTSLTLLGRYYLLAVVTSSALSRLAACMTASGLVDLLPPAVRFSAEDSLPMPTSKPDPAIYQLALARLGIVSSQAIALEHSVNGTRSAITAGIHTAGIVQFVPAEERTTRRSQLLAAGAQWVADSWGHFTQAVLPRSPTGGTP